MDLSGVVSALQARLPELGERMAQRIRSDVDAYKDASLIPFDSLRRSCTANADLLLYQLGRAGAQDPSPARETGRLRAEQGVPLADTLHAYRIGFEFLWTDILAEARNRPEVTDAQLVSQSAEIWALFGRYAEAVAAAYRETTAELTSRRQARRSALVEALFTGVIADRTLWEAARELGLPDRGPYVVAAAAADAPGEEPLAGTEAALRQAQIPFAWRLLPDQQIGLAALPTATAESTCLSILRRAGARVGVSPCFHSLGDTPRLCASPVWLWPASRAPAPASRGSTTTRWPWSSPPPRPRRRTSWRWSSSPCSISRQRSVPVSWRPWSTGTPPPAPPRTRRGASSSTPTPSATGCAASRSWRAAPCPIPERRRTSARRSWRSAARARHPVTSFSMI
uniref:Uncharacterized protein n=1 Tax=Streptomyces avermitilis TaxID=33903 RepID=A0A499V4T7_STRAX|nr:hypothetical protein SAVMC3_04690 [Streptomyces avermitilis]